MMTDYTKPRVEQVALPKGDSTPLLQWFTQSEIYDLLKPQTQSEVNGFIYACGKCTARGIESFKQYLWREYHAIHNI